MKDHFGGKNDLIPFLKLSLHWMSLSAFTEEFSTSLCRRDYLAVEILVNQKDILEMTGNFQT